MDGWVACGECTTRYDAATFTFCPRCGSTRATPVKQQMAAAAANPARGAHHPRRLQAGGAILLVLGLAGCLLAGITLGPAFHDVEKTVGSLLSGQAENLPGGTLELHTLRGGQPIAANITVFAGGTVVDHATSDAAGNATLALGMHGAATIRIEAAGLNATRNVLVLQDSGWPLTIDLQDAPDDAWHGLSDALRAGLWFLAAAAFLLAFGGLAAVLRRLRWMAYLGPIPALALALFAATGISLGGWALAATLGGGYILVILGRGAFR